jgi:hypothetical protein
MPIPARPSETAKPLLRCPFLQKCRRRLALAPPPVQKSTAYNLKTHAQNLGDGASGADRTIPGHSLLRASPAVFSHARPCKTSHYKCMARNLKPTALCAHIVAA